MDEHKFYLDSYYFELTQRDVINQSLALHVGVIGFLTAAMAYMIDKLNCLAPGTCFDSTPTSLFIVFFIAFSISEILLIFFLLRAFSGHQFAYFPEYRKTLEHLNKYEKYLSNNKYPDPEYGRAVEFRVLLVDLAVTTASHNKLTNYAKSAARHRASQYLVFSTIFAILCSINYIWSLL